MSNGRQKHKGKKRPRSWHRRAKRPVRMVERELQKDQRTLANGGVRPITDADKVGHDA